MQSSNTSRVRFTVISHIHVRSRFYHIHNVYKRNWDGPCLMNLTQNSYILFKWTICSIALLILGETCHLKGRDMVTVWRTVLLLSGYNCDSTHQHYDVTQFENVLWRHTMHEWVMNIHHKPWIAQGRFTNMILTPSKQWGVCDKKTKFHMLDIDGFVPDCSNSIANAGALAMELLQSCTQPLKLNLPPGAHIWIT